MPLQETIDEIRDGLEQERFHENEMSVRQGIVEPLLQGLGWPTNDTRVVYPEYPIAGGRVDYALCCPPVESIVLIEAKSIGKIDEGAEQQLFSYAFHQGVPILVLTNGQQWQFFYTFSQGDYDKRKVCVLNLNDSNSEKIANLLQKYLNYASIQNGDAAQVIEADYRLLSSQRVAMRHLPDTWRGLLEGADELLIELVVEATEDFCGHRPSKEQVLVFLKNLESVPASREAALPSPSPHLQKPGTRGKPKRSPSKRLRVTMDDGTVIEDKTQSATLVEAIEKAGIEQVHALRLKGLVKRKNRDEPPKSSDYTSDSSGFYSIRTVDGAENKKKILDKIGKQLGMQWKVEVIER